MNANISFGELPDAPGTDESISFVPQAQPPTGTAPSGGAQLTDWTEVSIAELFHARQGQEFRRLRGEKSRWLFFDADAGWAEDLEGIHVRSQFLRLLRDLPNEPLPANLSALQVTRRRKATKGVAKSFLNNRSLRSLQASLADQPGVSISDRDICAGPDELPVRNGLVDLRTGKLSPHSRERVILTRVAHAYDPAATCPAWEQFLLDVCSGDQSLVDYLQLVIGYSLTAHTSVQQMWLLTGSGSNGKSTLLKALQELLGPYAQQAAPKVLLTGTASDHSPEIARMQDKRLVVLSESNEGKTLNAERVKALVSADRQAARNLFENYLEFDPVAKLMLATNHLPQVDRNDQAMWRRLRVIPFTAVFPSVGSDKNSQLRNELPGILAWAVRGAVRWYTGGGQLNAPAAVQQATASYRGQGDRFAPFMAKHLTFGSALQVTAKDLRTAYEAWCSQGGSNPLSATAVSARLKLQGATSKQEGKHREWTWTGVALTTPASPASASSAPGSPVTKAASSGPASPPARVLTKPRPRARRTATP